MLKRLLIVTIRAVRGSSTGKAVAVLTLLGAGYGATQLATLVSERANQKTMLAGTDETLENEAPAKAEGPWAESLGARDYERIVSVVLLPGDDVAFAGLSVGLNPNDGSEARLVRTASDGEVLSETVLSDSSDATVSDIELGNNGDAFLTAWEEGAIKVTKVDVAGQFLWERRFNVTNQAARVLVAPSPDGAAMVLLSEAFEEGGMRVMRLDGDGRVVWRRDVSVAIGGTRSLGVTADSIGGGVFAASVEQPNGAQGVELVRLDRRGREIWRRTVRTGDDAGLSDLYVDADGVSVLIGGQQAQVFKLDPLGQFIWARDLPDIRAARSKIVGRSDTGELHVIAEPRQDAGGDESQAGAQDESQTGRSRLWMASFDADGQPRWTRLRGHNRQVRIEDFEVDSRGGIFAGGSIARRTNSDTDMLMLFVTADGQFPKDFAAVTLTEDDVSRPAERRPLVSLETGQSILASATVPAATADPDASVEETENPSTSVREVSAPDALPVSSVAVAPIVETTVTVDPPSQEAPEEAGTDVEEAATAAATEPQSADVTGNSVDPEVVSEAPAPARPRLPAVQTIAAPQGTLSGNYSYDCTFICQATMVDESLKFPVTRRISDVSESNSELFSLDAMALDAGICLSEGGRLAEGARLPPVCERLN
ncbi:MAG: hypothetical protein AAGJ32_07455 [Pseudomonadota bacterium]